MMQTGKAAILYGLPAGGRRHDGCHKTINYRQQI